MIVYSIGQIELGCCNLRLPMSLVKNLHKNLHISPAGVAFVKSNVRRGIMPIMLEEILETRFMVKKCMKEYKNDKVRRLGILYFACVMIL